MKTLLFWLSLVCLTQVGISSDCVCGRENGNKPVSRIIGGQETLEHQYPWMVAVTTFAHKAILAFCGGALINNKYVITAAHCVDALPEEALRVVIGRHHLYKTPPSSLIAVEKVRIYPGWSRRTLKHDIAILKLNQTLDFSDTKLGAVCLPDQDEWQHYDNLFAPGWGTMQANKKARPPFLMEVNLPEWTDMDDCLIKWGLYPDQKQYKICAGAVGLDTCEGDSGGPLMSRNSKGTYLVGVVSIGSEECGDGNPALYSRITGYLDWILKETSDSNYCKKP